MSPISMLNALLSFLIALPLTIAALAAFLAVGPLLRVPMPLTALVYAAAFWFACMKLRRTGLLIGAIGWSLYVFYEGYMTWVDRSMIRIDLFFIVLPILVVVTAAGLWSGVQWYMEGRKRR